MKVYLVGGAVRDAVMGVENNDRDFLVVGATAADMKARGYLNVGESFPVFWDPATGDQYALARKERKTGTGYRGFSVEFDPSVSLAEDLSRRDLTINAMARDLETGEIEDPYGGMKDLEAKVLRHVSNAFAEDPLRVVRLARFYARFGDFVIAQETIDLAVSLVHSGELDTLADERFWAEMEKVFEQAEDPFRFFKALWAFGAISDVKFFKDVFGSASVGAVGFGNAFGATKIARHLAKSGSSSEEVLMTFLGLVSSRDAKLSSKAVPTRVKTLVKNMWAVRDMPVDVTPQAVVEFLNKNRAWDPQHQSVNDLVTTMTIAEALGEKFVVSSAMMEHVVAVGRKVTAAPYMHLSGAEIGKAMAGDRLARIFEVMKG